jgi:hypothetical protein
LKSERDAKIQELQDHFYRIKAKLEVAAKLKVAEFWTFAVNVDTHLLAAFECLNSVPDAALTTVAHRYRDDPRRGAQPPASVHGLQVEAYEDCCHQRGYCWVTKARIDQIYRFTVGSPNILYASALLK